MFELLRFDDDVRARVAERQRASEMRSALMSRGWRTMRSDGLDKARMGITTLEEVFRVTQDEFL